MRVPRGTVPRSSPSDGRFSTFRLFLFGRPRLFLSEDTFPLSRRPSTRLSGPRRSVPVFFLGFSASFLNVSSTRSIFLCSLEGLEPLPSVGSGRDTRWFFGLFELFPFLFGFLLLVLLLLLLLLLLALMLVLLVGVGVVSFSTVPMARFRKVL